MSEKPILFSTPMVRATITCAKCGEMSVPFPCERCGSTEFRKTQTRRCHLKPQPPGWWSPDHFGDIHKMVNGEFVMRRGEPVVIGWGPCSADGQLGYCLPYRNEDELWVREKIQPLYAEGVGYWDADWNTGEGYAVGYPATDGIQEYVDSDDNLTERCIPAIHMPKWAARIRRRVKGVRVEHVQDISEADAEAEGIETDAIIRKVHDDAWNQRREEIYERYGTPVADTRTAGNREIFAYLWDSLNSKPKPSTHNPYTWAKEACFVSYPWESVRETREHRGKPWYVVGNPWIAVYEFERTER